MRVSFETYTLVCKRQGKEYLQMFERENVKRVEGYVVDTLVMPMLNIFSSKMDQKPCFVVALDDGTFTHVPVAECKRVG